MSVRAPARAAFGRRGNPDRAIVLTAVSLVLIGLVMSLSASSVRSTESTGSAFTLFARQFAWGAMGAAALIVGWRFDYRRMRGWAYMVLPGIWFLLFLTLLPGIGTRIGGASRWLAVGPLSFQPSEFAKLALVLFSAEILSRKMGRLDDLGHLAFPFLVSVGVTVLLVLSQPDFGTAVIIGVVSLIIAWVAGTNARLIGGIAATAAIVAVPVMVAAPYRRARLVGFLSGAEDCLNTAYQTCQGLVALGSGGWFGLGLGSSRQKYRYLPNPDTDFIFAILGEEAGLIGTLIVLGLFATLAVYGIRAARRAPDPFGFMLAVGITAWLTLQALVNIGAVTGLLPITGVPLPLISFGGTSLLVSLAALGVLASVARRGRARRAT